MKYYIAILLISFCQVTGAQQQIKQDSTKKTTSHIDTQNDTPNFSEAKAYKLLYENQVKSNDAILKTVFYALGGLGTAVLLVFGSNWWFKIRRYGMLSTKSTIK